MGEWGACVCGDGPDKHEAVVLRPICIDPGNRVLFEGTLGRCVTGCGCAMYSAAMYAEATQDGGPKA